MNSPKTDEFRERLAKGEEINNILPEAYAVVKNSAAAYAELKSMSPAITRNGT